MAQKEDPIVLRQAFDDLLIPYWLDTKANQIYIEDGSSRAVFSFSTEDDYLGFHIDHKEP